MTNKRKNKIGSFLVLFVVQLLLLGAFAFHYFTKKKLGMIRHVVYLNGKWESNYPMGIFRIAAIVLLLFFIFLQMIRIRKRKERLTTLFICLLTFCCAGFIFWMNTDWSRAYYLMSICLVIYGVLLNLWLILQNRKI